MCVDEQEELIRATRDVKKKLTYDVGSGKFGEAGGLDCPAEFGIGISDEDNEPMPLADPLKDSNQASLIEQQFYDSENEEDDDEGSGEDLSDAQDQEDRILRENVSYRQGNMGGDNTLRLELQ